VETVVEPASVDGPSGANSSAQDEVAGKSGGDGRCNGQAADMGTCVENKFAEDVSGPYIAMTPMPLARSIPDRQAQLAVVNGELAAVLVRLDHEAHETLRGHWVIEAAFGCYDAEPRPSFETLSEAEAWIRSRFLGRRGA
jgi:hypothetical protein